MTTFSKVSTPAIRFLAASAIALGLVPVTAHAYDKTGCPAYAQYDASERMPNHFKALNLSPDQQEKIRAIEANHREIMQKNMTLMRANRTAERELVEAPNFDEAKAEKLAASNAKIMENNNLTTLRFRHEIYQILTPEQRAKFDTMRKQRQDSRQR